MSDDPAFNDVSWSASDLKMEYCCVAGRFLRWDDDKKRWIDQRDGSSWSIEFNPIEPEDPSREQNDVRSG